MGAKRTAIAYIRQSVVKKKLESPAIQRAMIEAWAQAHDIIIVGEVRDLNRSGGTLTRPGLIEAKKALSDGQADGIVVARSDRASRVALDGLGLIDELEREGRWIAAADDSIDTTTRVGRMATTMNLAIAQNEYERYREQSAVVHRRAVVEKGRQMGPTPFGYLRDDENRLVVDADRARWVRHIFERRADGVGWLQISREVDEAGVRQANGRLVSPLLCSRIGGNRVYLGEAHHKPHIHEGAHPAIVDEALFTAAERVPRAVRSTNRGGAAHTEPILRGLVRCSGCRYAMKRIPAGHFTRWRCRTLVGERTATHECGSPAYLAGRDGVELERVVIDRFFGLVERLQAQRTEPGPDVAALERAAVEADALLDELSSLDVRRELGADRWGKLVREARDGVEQARQALDAAQADARRGRATGESAELRTWWETAAVPEKQEALRSIVQSVFIDAGTGPVAARAHVIPVWESVEIPKTGSSGFHVRPWLPGRD